MAASAQRPSANRALPGAAPQRQPPPPVARPKTPVAPPPPPAPPLLLLEAAPLEAEVPPCDTHWPPWHWSPSGQITPVQGHVPQTPVSGSQHEAPVHMLAAHLSATHAGGVCDVSQVLPLAQAGAQVAAQTPSTQAWPLGHVTAAHGVMQVNVVKSGLGLHSCPALQLVAVQGSVWQAPPTQTLPQPEQGWLKQVSATHLPALGP
jgi:hypothetical protein